MPSMRLPLTTTQLILLLRRHNDAVLNAAAFQLERHREMAQFWSKYRKSDQTEDARLEAMDTWATETLGP